MLDKKHHIIHLIKKRLLGKISPGEDAELQDWLAENEEHRKLLEQLTNDDLMDKQMTLFVRSQVEDAWMVVQKNLNTKSPEAARPRHQTKKYIYILGATAAAFIIIVSFSIWYFFVTKQNNEDSRSIVEMNPYSRHESAIPAYKAKLTLSNGNTILLHTIKDGTITTDGVFKLLKHNEYLYYKTTAIVSTDRNIYNSLSTLNGSHFRVILPGGSIINLNVATAVKLDVSSISAIRNVEITSGEAEFSVTPDSKDSFRVTMPAVQQNGITGIIEVKGTRFNVKAYEDDNEKRVTLLEGNLDIYTLPAYSPELTNVSMAGYPATSLKRGDQALLQDDGKISVRHNVDTAEVVSWKNGIVSFNKSHTLKMLKLISRWYDVNVEFSTTKVPEFYFTGKITPETDIQTVIDIMQFQCDSLHMKYDSTARKISVLP
mgnify:CR=1 FL=1|jgi:Fe2+-dicitrate sensor, membrane component